MAFSNYMLFKRFFLNSTAGWDGTGYLSKHLLWIQIVLKLGDFVFPTSVKWLHPLLISLYLALIIIIIIIIIVIVVIIIISVIVRGLEQKLTLTAVAVVKILQVSLWQSTIYSVIIFYAFITDEMSSLSERLREKGVDMETERKLEQVCVYMFD